MSIRVDSSPLIAGAVVVGVPGLGVLAETVPSTGEHGAGYLFPSLEFPADAGKEVRGLITTWPTLGTLTAFEDSSFEYDGPSDTFAFQMYVDGVAVGTPQTVTITVGATAAVSPSRGRYAVSGHAPAVLQGDAQAVAPQAGHAQAHGYAPTLAQPITIAPSNGSITATSYAPTVEQTPSVRPQAGRIAANGYSPTIGHAQTVAPTRAQTVATGRAPIVVKGVRVDSQTGRVEWAGHAPAIAQGGARTVVPAVGRVRAMGRVPSVTTTPIGGYPSSVTITVPSGRTITLRPR